MNLLSKYRSCLKKEIGMFFPMLILRVLENVLQPSFLQKMTVLNLLDKLSQDSQIIIDIFVNYDCDVDASNIFERYHAFVILCCRYLLTMSTCTNNTVSLLDLECLINREWSLWLCLKPKLTTNFVDLPNHTHGDCFSPHSTFFSPYYTSFCLQTVLAAVNSPYSGTWTTWGSNTTSSKFILPLFMFDCCIMF